jgi:hypothetical protein
MNFNNQINLILEGLKEKFKIITDDEIKKISEMYQIDKKYIKRINRYTVKVVLMSPSDSWRQSQTHGWGSEPTKADMVKEETHYINHLQNGLWRTITVTPNWKKVSKSIVYNKTIGYNPNPWECDIHRLDGPAVITKNEQLYYIDGKEYTEKDYWNDYRVKMYNKHGQSAVDTADAITEL